MAAVVTALRERPRDRVDVELDGAPWRTLPAAVVVRAGLTVGRALDRRTARIVARELRSTRAAACATRALRAHDRSRGELEARLERAGVPTTARAEALEALERAGLVDDSRVARIRAETLAWRGYGDAAIRADLERRHLPAEAVEEALAALEPEAERVRNLLQREHATPAVLRRLAARGFDRELLGELAAFAREA
ncbi:MAG TPA: RecX family transcriptional regulator [Gaiellaceae bacterium]|nr:RecX family transcriptional regulator [Gaiellaceae bacterium]